MRLLPLSIGLVTDNGELLLRDGSAVTSCHGPQAHSKFKPELQHLYLCRYLLLQVVLHTVGNILMSTLQHTLEQTPMFGGPHLFPKNVTSLNSWMNRGEEQWKERFGFGFVHWITVYIYKQLD